MAQVVQPDGRKAGLSDKVLEPVGDGLGVPGLTVGADEEQAGLGPRRAADLPPPFTHAEVVAQHGDCGGSERGDAVSGAALDLLGDRPVPDGGDLLGDGQRAAVKSEIVGWVGKDVDVEVAQPASLAAA